MKKSTIAILVAVAFSATACSRVETGEVGLRVGFDKQVNSTELMPGSFNQTMVGDVLLFPVRDISMNLDDMHPQTSDNSTLADMDVTVIYSINPATVSDLYTTKAKAFHAVNDKGEVFLMYNYIQTITRNAAYKAAAEHEALKTISTRDAIEKSIGEHIAAALKEEKSGNATLAESLTITKVQIRNIQPAQSIIDSANAAISKQNEFIAKQKEVQIAEQEAKRQEFLSRPANLEYMRVQAALNISEGVRDGKVQTIIVPSNFSALGQIK